MTRARRSVSVGSSASTPPAVYQRSPFSIPVLRRKVAAVVEHSGLAAESRSGQALIEALKTYPFDELLQISPEELSKIALDIVALEERQQVRLFVRRGTFGRFLSCLVYLPRDRYNTTIRLRMQDILQTAFHGVHVDYSTRLAESVLVRLHFVVYTEAGANRRLRRRGDRSQAWPRQPGTGPTTCGPPWESSAARSRVSGSPVSYAEAFPAAYRGAGSPPRPRWPTSAVSNASTSPGISRWASTAHSKLPTVSPVSSCSAR